jgi:hypothetical protein
VLAPESERHRRRPAGHSSHHDHDPAQPLPVDDAIDIANVDSLLTDEEREVRGAARSFCSQCVDPHAAFR